MLIIVNSNNEEEESRWPIVSNEAGIKKLKYIRKNYETRQNTLETNACKE